jgi:RHS repeat-associated protein
LGRIREVGQKNLPASGLAEPGYLEDNFYRTFLAQGSNSQITQTIYDEQPMAVNGVPAGLSLNNLRKRVAASIYRETPTNANINATYYNYDVDGNVKNLYQQINGLGVKELDYEYDLVSGKVNFLAYQHGKNDQFYYQYKYDAENRLVEAASSTMANVVSYGMGSSLNDPDKKVDATYQYYLHGPLARMELGPNLALVQGMDYAYTLQGWLKGVNGTHLDGQGSDIGQDGAVVAKDALAYSLGYYQGDYKPIGGSGATAFSSLYQYNAGDITGNNLYNGNISSSTYAIAKINTAATAGYTYKYDQLNRLKTLRQHAIGSAGTWNSNSLSGNYAENFKYDGNGNILELQRNAAAAQSMDRLAYQYNLDGNGRLSDNRLASLVDAVNSGQQGELSGTTNYSYDLIGNLTADSKEGITAIDWSVYGKIRQIDKSSGNIVYSYDASGNRVSKLYNNKTTWYVRDAQGNSLAVYDNENNGQNWKEQQLYGSSRLGMWKPEINVSSSNGSSIWSISGKKNYELNNHLGNVMAVITDNRLQNSTIYEPDVINAQDYYAFGSQMPGRIFNLGGYRYGFNGKENDDDVEGTGNQQDYGMRIYDPRIGKFLSVDPITKNYPELTPYQFASNRPIDGIDLDGLEYAPPMKIDKNGERVVDGEAQLKQMRANGEGLVGLFMSAYQGLSSAKEMIRSPVKSAHGIVHVVSNPVKTAKAIKEDYTKSIQENEPRAYGKISGDIFQIFYGGKLLKGPLVEETISKISLTSTDGFLMKGFEIKTPFDISVQRFGNLSIGKSDFWGLKIGSNKFVNRTFAAIKEEWNPLTQYTEGVIPKGTPVKFGIIGPQGLKYPGGSFQFIIDSKKVTKQSSKIIRR